MEFTPENTDGAEQKKAPRLKHFDRLEAIVKAGMRVLTHPQLKVLLAFEVCANKYTADASPSIVTVARWIGDKTLKRVRKQAADLVELGWLEVVSMGGGRKNTNVYRVLVPSEALLIVQEERARNTGAWQAPVSESDHNEETGASEAPESKDEANQHESGNRGVPARKQGPTGAKTGAYYAPRTERTGRTDSPPAPASGNGQGTLIDTHRSTAQTVTTTRPANPIWDAIAKIWFGGKVAKPDSSRVGRLVSNLTAHGATAEEIPARLERMKAEWPKISHTPEALVKHWARYHVENANDPVDPEERELFQRKAHGEAIGLSPDRQRRYEKFLPTYKASLKQ